MKRKTAYTLLIIAFVLSFFVTPLGYWGKVWLMQLFASPPEMIKVEQQTKLSDYSWRLKDANGEIFSFSKSKGKVIFLQFWASWHTPSAAELSDIQKLYTVYGDQVDFYIVTNEERFPVEEFMRKNKYTFPITYRIVGESSPIEILEPSGTYIIDHLGKIVVKSENTKDWYNKTVQQLLEKLLKAG